MQLSTDDQIKWPIVGYIPEDRLIVVVEKGDIGLLEGVAAGCLDCVLVKCRAARCVNNAVVHPSEHSLVGEGHVARLTEGYTKQGETAKRSVGLWYFCTRSSAVNLTSVKSLG